MRYAMILVMMLVACDRSAARKKWSPAAKVWADQFTVTMSQLMCQDTMYFVSCFEVTAAGCRDVVRAETERCLDRHADLVLTVVDEASGRAAGTEIGRCAGGGAEIEIRAHHSSRNVPLCSDLAYWTRAAQQSAAAL